MAKTILKLIPIAIIPCLLIYLFIEVNNGRDHVSAKTGYSIFFILIDQTDPYEQGDIEHIQTALTHINSSLCDMDKLVALEINPNSPYEPTKILEKNISKPTKGNDPLLSSKNNPNKTQDDLFEELKKALEPAVSKKEKSTNPSPILESLVYITDRDDYRTAQNRDIYIFSDMMQNSRLLNVYKQDPADARIHDSQLSDRRFDFLNGSIHITKTARREHWEKMPTIKNFWNKLFMEHNGKSSWE